VAEVVYIEKPSLDLWVFVDVVFLEPVVCSNDLAEWNKEVSTDAEAVMHDWAVEACTGVTNAGSCGRGRFGTTSRTIECLCTGQNYPYHWEMIIIGYIIL
jgi:hypothetical protein